MRLALSRGAALVALLTALSILTLGAASATAAPPTATVPSKVNRPQFQKEVQAAIGFLGQSQGQDGSFSPQVGPGVTALVTTAVLRHGRTPQDPVVAKGLKYLEGFVQPTGGIHHPQSRLKTYETCLAMVCFQEANKDGHYNDLIKKADAYIRGLQKDADDGKSKADTDFGGAGYGGGGRPDLSNTHFLVEALRSAGAGASDPALQNALVFISRCQNLESEHNATQFAAKVQDGGFYYSPSGDGSSPAGKTDAGGLRSYGAMTYAGLKSMLYAGVDEKDARVKAAVEWIRKNYDVSSNPGLGQAGVYYYFHLFAKALDVLGQNEFVDASGKKHDWRQELVAELAKRQNPNGSWTNSDSRWLEGDANLSTGFALLALSYCKP